MNKAERFTPGFICVLHTFGRDLKWNPHIHVLLTEGACGNREVWRPITYFNYTLLRNSFRMVLLNELEKHFGPSFKKIKAYCYKNCPNGFYVYAKPAISNPKDVINYIGRYLGRPVIGMSRIDHYDGQNVTFHYKRHEDNQLVTETIPATEFIKKLIRHIPDKHFKMLRYYGLYASRKHKHSDQIFTMIHKNHHDFNRMIASWRFQLQLAFGFDPLRCKQCGVRLSFAGLFQGLKPLNEIYLWRLGVP